MDLAGFDPSTMNYLETQMQHPHMTGGPDPFQEMLLPNDYQDHRSTYGGYAGSDDLNYQGISQPPQLKRFASTTYEDPFSDIGSAFDNPIAHDHNEPETPSIDRDNKLLSFTLPSFEYTLLDYNYRRTTISLTAQLHGMFFLAESPWAAAGDAQPPPTELTCYRRNLFQITGDVTLPRTLRYILTEQGDQIPIIGQELIIHATESTEDNTVKIISVPWKTPTNPGQATADDKVEREPPSIPLDLMNVQDLNSDFASFPFQWKRLQFRIATANNGRRRELQQHFVVRLKVLATLATGGKIPICQIQSGAIIVRGRSPRNFQARKDLPLNGGSHARKTSNSPGDSLKNRKNDGPTSAPVKTEPAPPAATMPSYFDARDGPMPNDGYGWPGQASMGAMKGAMTAVPPPTSSPYKAAANMYPISSPDLTRTQRPAIPPAGPINLSLVEDDSPKPASNTLSPEERSTKRIQIPARPSSFTVNTINSPDESADLLYEYFPLGLDDWMPPVDAVYRPHVVHHTKLPSDPRDPKASAKSAKSKRYFSEDVS